MFKVEVRVYNPFNEGDVHVFNSDNVDSDDLVQILSVFSHEDSQFGSIDAGSTLWPDEDVLQAVSHVKQLRD